MAALQRAQGLIFLSSAQALKSPLQKSKISSLIPTGLL
jgi:hypothetical protein